MAGLAGLPRRFERRQLRVYRRYAALPDESGRLETGDEIRHLDGHPLRVYTPYVPRYAEMLEYVFKRLGWNPDRFHTYRVRIRYPMIPTSVGLLHALPEMPGGSLEGTARP